MKKNLYFHKITFLVTGISFALLSMEYAEAMNTQIQTDSTLSGISAMAIDSQGGNQIYTLSEINGKTVGGNLFYSFSNFSIGATDAAWFNLNTPDLANVISRVTGGAESIIDGHLQMTNVGSAPSFFFINPAGVTFGAGASIDVPGSFYVSTASGLNMSDGSVYAAHEAQASTLSAAEPESFGFLGNESRGINLSGLETDNVELTFKPGADVGLIGNNVHIKNSHISSTALADGDLTQEGLNIQIAATGEESVNFNFANRNTQGNLIIESSHIEASGNGAGFLGIRAGDFKATDSFLFVDNTGEIPMTADHGVDVFVRSLLVLDHSIISSDALGNSSDPDTAMKGNAGSVIVRADSIEMLNGGNISSSSSADGNAGQIDVVANTIRIDGIGTYFDNNDNPVEIRSGVSSSSQLGASGNAGIVLVAARDSLIMSNAGAIESDSHSSGAAGDVIVEAGQITISDNAFISSDALSTGGSGTVQVIATDINIVGTGNKNALTGISSTSGSDSQNNIGIVMVKAESLSIVNGGTINTSTASSEEGGFPGITVSANHINLDSGGNISSSTSGNADAGVIEVTTDSLNLINTGSISTLTSGQGDAGFVTINARTIEIDGQNNKSNELTGITSSAQLGESEDFTEIGSAGVITIAGIGHTDSNPVLAETLHIKNRGGIVSFTEALNPADYIGAIKISAENIYIETEGSINTSSSGINNAGIIEVNFQEMLFLGSSSKISTEANQGNGGDITISGGGIVYLRDSAITTSVSGQEGNGGDINISANSLIMDSGFIQANTAAVGASGGDVNIKVPVLVPSGGFLQTGGNTPFDFQPFSGINVIQAAAPDGVSGTITAASPQLNLSGVLTNLVIESFDSNTLSQNMCAVEQGSSLYQSGKGGLRMRARDFLLLPVF